MPKIRCFYITEDEFRLSVYEITRRYSKREIETPEFVSEMGFLLERYKGNEILLEVARGSLKPVSPLVHSVLEHSH